MPLAVRRGGGGGGGVQQKALVSQLLADHSGTEESREEVKQDVEPRIDQSDLWLVKYDELALKTNNIPLSHLSCCRYFNLTFILQTSDLCCCREGGELFSRLCMLVDINQQYVELGLFPQWDDVARELNIDSMKTEWVRVCVRPEQSFTRAILEIYMQDGGTLGEVIAALRKQKQYRVIQEISDLAEEFLDVYNTYHKENLRSSEAGGPAGPHLYSILRTLCDTFHKAGQEDPLGKFQLYSGGFKQYMRSRDVTINSGFNMQYQGKEGSNEDSGYTSPHRYAGNLPPMSEATLEQTRPLSEITRLRSKKLDAEEEVEEDLKAKQTIRILLVFARDGASTAEEIVTGMVGFECEDYPTIRVDFFRLNELELWHALLINPEGCLMKWLDEMDFVMPVLTPQYLQDLHDSSIPAGPPAPTSAMINKYLYSFASQRQKLERQCSYNVAAM